MLSKKYKAIECEKKWQDFWRDNNIYKFEHDSSKEVFSIDTPPPTVSGSLHIGHIFSYTQAEMIARFQRLQGKNVFYPFGFDDNGLPTERLVEKERGIMAHKIDTKEFNDICVSITKKYETEFKELWEAMGFSVDWSLKYETINEKVQKISQKSFLRMAKRGRAYIKESPVLWCTNCRTSIAQAELETANIDATFNYLSFKVGEEELIVATTRPELLFSCVCLFINSKDERYKDYIGKKALVPLYDYEVPIFADEKVDINKGTGIVMCATFGDTTDVEWFEEHKLPFRKIIEEDGKIKNNVDYIGGLKVLEARAAIIKLLNEKELIKKCEKITHTVAVHERCGNPIEIIPSKQWYIDILNYKKELLEAGDKINWYPASMKTRYTAWVENLKWDWCISRQRYLGIHFPIWYCKHCGNILYAEEDQLPINPVEIAPNKTCSCGAKDYIPETAVFDTWATSSTTPLINMGWEEEGCIDKKFLPMSLRTQAHEIIRTWAFYTVVKSLFHTGEIPWKDIMISGFVLAKKGEKISKSKNNSALSPKNLIDKYSADALRYWAAGAKLGTDTMFDEGDLKISSRFITKLWNASAFSIMHLQDFDGKEPKIIKYIDRWILHRLKETEKKAKGFLNNYEVGLALKEIDEFFWKDFCDNYLEIIKDRLYKPEIHGDAARKSAQYVLYKTLLGILKLYSIYVPHITEEIYQNYFRSFENIKSIHLLLWNSEESNKDKELQEFGERLTTIVSGVRKLKSEKNISLKEPISKINIEVEDLFIAMFNDTILDLKACTGAKTIDIKSAKIYKVQVIE